MVDTSEHRELLETTRDELVAVRDELDVLRRRLNGHADQIHDTRVRCGFPSSNDEDDDDY
jgi:hypothetical protein